MEYVVSRSQRPFYFEGKVLRSRWLGSSVGTRAGLEVHFPFLELNPDSSVITA